MCVCVCVWKGGIHYIYGAARESKDQDPLVARHGEPVVGLGGLVAVGLHRGGGVGVCVCVCVCVWKGGIHYIYGAARESKDQDPLVARHGEPVVGLGGLVAVGLHRGGGVGGCVCVCVCGKVVYTTSMVQRESQKTKTHLSRGTENQ